MVFIKLLCLVSLTASTYAACPSGWIANGSGSCLLFPDTTYSPNAYMQFPACEQFCTTVGGPDSRPPCIRNAAENEFIRSRVPMNTWIGYFDWAWEGHFTWRTGCASTYTAWDSGEPNNQGGEDFVMLKPVSSKWQDVKADRNNYCVCEMPEPVTPTLVCPPGYILDVAGDQKCYKFHASPMNYAACKIACGIEGSSRLCIQNQKQNDFIHRIGKGDTWIGLTDVLIEGEFRWYGACSAPNPLTSDWARSQLDPNEKIDSTSSVDDYMILRGPNGKWLSYSDTSSFYCGCEMTPFPPTLSPTKAPTRSPTRAPSRPTAIPTIKPTATPTTRIPFACPLSDPTYKMLSENGESTCYKFGNGRKSYADCYSFCDALGKVNHRLTTLPQDASEVENDFLVNNAPAGGSIWSAWRWEIVSGGNRQLKWDMPCYVSPQPPAYDNWKFGEPSWENNESLPPLNLCTEIYGSSHPSRGEWNDVYCIEQAECVCETRLEPGGLPCSNNFRRRNLRGEAADLNATLSLA